MTMTNLETIATLVWGIICLIISLIFLQKLWHMLESDVPYKKGKWVITGGLAFLGDIIWTLCILIVNGFSGTEYKEVLYYCTVFMTPVALHLMIKSFVDPIYFWIRERRLRHPRIHMSRRQMKKLNDVFEKATVEKNTDCQKE